MPFTFWSTTLWACWLFGFLERSVWSDLLTYWIFLLTYTLIAKHHFGAYNFSKSQ
ncbi:hypothetical protein Hanom_Chr05g00388661 [Helianthus anomalus]